jgi:hypothetical protein
VQFTQSLADGQRRNTHSSVPAAALDPPGTVSTKVVDHTGGQAFAQVA